METDEFVSALRAKAEQGVEQYKDLQHEQARLARCGNDLKDYVEKMNVFLEEHGLTPVAMIGEAG